MLFLKGIKLNPIRSTVWLTWQLVAWYVVWRTYTQQTFQKVESIRMSNLESDAFIRFESGVPLYSPSSEVYKQIERIEGLMLFEYILCVFLAIWFLGAVLYAYLNWRYRRGKLEWLDKEGYYRQSLYDLCRFSAFLIPAVWYKVYKEGDGHISHFALMCRLGAYIELFNLVQYTIENERSRRHPSID